MTYKGDYPDFKSSGHVRTEVEIDDMQGDYYYDYKKAEEKLDGSRPENTIWHHHENRRNMQAVDEDIHKRFTHQGGVSATKNSE